MPHAATDTSRFNEFAAGARDMLPMLLGAAPFGVIFGTLVGLIFGRAFPGLQALGLDFAMVATFIAIVVPQLNTLRSLAAALSAGALAYAWQDWPYKLGLLAAVLCGIGVGMALSRGVRVEAAAGEAAP